jgi:hypothetical protein
MAVGGTFGQAAILVSDLVGRLPSERRDTLAQQVIEIADPLGFGIACMRWLRHDAERGEVERLLSAEGEAALETVLAERARASAAREPLYLSDPDDAVALHYLWSKRLGGESLQTELAQRFSANPAEVDAFLASYLNDAHDMATGEPVRSTFNRDNYNHVARAIDPATIAENLRARYDIPVPQHYQSQDTPVGLAVANQFLFVHQRALQEVAAADEAGR